MKTKVALPLTAKGLNLGASIALNFTINISSLIAKSTVIEAQ